MPNLPLSTVLSLSNAQIVIEIAATVAFAMSGLLEAARKRLDAIGVVMVAGLTAFGGGTLRDVLLDRRPFFWVEHSNWLWLLLAVCACAMAFLRAQHFAPTERAMQWPDALGLGLFTATGTQIALDASMPAIVAVVMGMMTAAFGGVLRDIVCNEIPRAFSDHQPYAICAFVGAWVIVVSEALQAPDWLVLTLGAGTTVLLRMLAIRTGWKLPGWRA
ncbi:trimeric intracellular cation channel family protein [Variovorax sp. J22P168]|uniref:trimeric intracellular cation channel family protein n=1 Tax=Variovorax jilinensis TaxID=3053513 RepID=UPI002575CDB7|nr:trimeric intracellular cation channel family protein [Variovorax sp. J22P168]MDM0012155.1 trimeric intracellular cation channel family protein [Variovorax sp. J22P168]